MYVCDEKSGFCFAAHEQSGEKIIQIYDSYLEKHQLLSVIMVV